MKKTTSLAALLLVAVSATAARAAERTLRHEAILDAPVADVWRAWTTDEGIRSWMAPNATVDFRVGGAYRTSYVEGVDLQGDEAIVNRILAFEPNAMIAMRNEQAPPDFAHAELFKDTWSVVRFEPVGTTRTRLTLAGYGYGEGELWDELYGFFEQGNAYVLATLKQRFQAPAERDHSPAAVVARLRPFAEHCWRVRHDMADGNVLRSVFVGRLRNGGAHLVANGWIGGAEGPMHAHGLAVFGANPATGTAWCWEYLEDGSLLDGPLWVEGDTVHMDLVLRSPDGTTRPMHGTYRFPDDDHVTWSMVNADGTPFMELTYERTDLDGLREWVPGAERSD